MSRLMVKTSENQKKMKLGFHKAEAPSACKLSILGNIVSPYLLQPRPSSHRGGRGEGAGGCDRDRSRDRETEASKPDKRSRSPDSSIESSSLQTGPWVGGGIDHEFEEMKWGLNMALIGQKSSDCFLCMFIMLDFNQFVEMSCNMSECFLLQVMDTGSHSTWWRTSTWRPRSTSG